MKSSTAYPCPGCETGQMFVFYELRDFPVHTVLNIPTRAQAIGYRRGDIQLAFCPECGFISNVSFDPGVLEYGSDCEEGQGFSPTFRTFAQGLAQRLVDRYALKGKTILEIGCGKGEFLSMLCAYGNNRGIGFDPAYVKGRSGTPGDGHVEFIRDFFSEKYSHYRADFICCQMTLEHIQPVGAFVSMVRRSIGTKESTVVFFQVPDMTRILRDCAFEDVYYEHCSYFTPSSLAGLFRRSGFEILDIQTEYEGQYLTIEARHGVTSQDLLAESSFPHSPDPSSQEGGHLLDHGHFPSPDGRGRLSPEREDLDRVAEYVSAFSSRVEKKLASWRAKTRPIAEGELRAVVWGSGSKGVSFLTNSGFGEVIEYVVDINPHRQGMFMPGTGQEIVGPDRLGQIRPDMVIVMNRIYEQEIKNELERLGLATKVVSL